MRRGPVGSDGVRLGPDGVRLGPMGSDWVISHTRVEIGNFFCISIIERVCKVHASERMNDCPVVGGRKYDVECGLVRRGPMGSDWVPMGSDGVRLGN